LSVLYSYVSESYADALNTEQPNATGTVGIVPAYGILDVNTTLRVNDNVELRANLNNLIDEQYFTKRPQFYPGPGIWPSDGRNFSFTVALRI
nr:TonB-dependent receptor [Flavobacteriales bacterium]